MIRDHNLKILVQAGIEESEARKELLILHKEFPSSPQKIEEIIGERIKTRKPLQYLLGKAFFMDFEVEINENVLIPRPETEILVEETVRRSVACNTSTILDIGTGSGIIAIALAKLIPNAKITAIDIKKEILDLAYKNAKKNNVEEKIQFKQCDIFSKCFEGLIEKNTFDLIISNPPYVKPEELKNLKPEVHLHEPRIALSGSRENKSGLIYYERMMYLCKDLINQTPTIIGFEIDPPLVNGLKDLLKKYNFNNYEIVKDYSKLDRCLFVYP